MSWTLEDLRALRDVSRPRGGLELVRIRTLHYPDGTPVIMAVVGPRSKFPRTAVLYRPYGRNLRRLAEKFAGLAL